MRVNSEEEAKCTTDPGILYACVSSDLQDGGIRKSCKVEGHGYMKDRGF